MSTSPARISGQATMQTNDTLIGRMRRLSTLDRLLVLALLAMSPLLVFGMMIVGGRIDRIALALGASALFAAAIVVATGRRWAPLLAAVPGALTFGVAGRFILESLVAPRETLNFGFWVALMAVMGVATVASITGTAQHYLAPARRGVPHIAASLIAAILALGMGAIVVAALPQPPLGIQVDTATLASLPAIGAKDFLFTTETLRVKPGETITIRLDNGDDGPHSLDIDELNVHTFMPSKSTALTIFEVATPGEYTFYCAIGTHRQAGMVGKLIVAP